MRALQSPRPASVSVRPLNQDIVQLEAKRRTRALSAEENAALDAMYEEAHQRFLSEQDVDAMAEADAEGRLLPKPFINFHD